MRALLLAILYRMPFAKAVVRAAVERSILRLAISASGIVGYGIAGIGAVGAIHHGRHENWLISLAFTFVMSQGAVLVWIYQSAKDYDDI